jgi:hypothetical protein
VPGLERLRVLHLPNADHQPFSEQRSHTVRSDTMKPASNRISRSGS